MISISELFEWPECTYESCMAYLTMFRTINFDFMFPVGVQKHVRDVMCVRSVSKSKIAVDSMTRKLEF